MPDRFFAPDRFDQPTITLTGPEAHHLREVRRLRVGGEVELFDGEGTGGRAEIVSLKKGEVELRLLETWSDEPRTAPRLLLATAVPKGERFRWLVEKCTELGVDQLIPLNTARSVVDPRETRLEKMRGIVVAACKQCGRNRLMEIEPILAWNDFLKRFAGDAADNSFPADTSQNDAISTRLILMADKTGIPIGNELSRISDAAARERKELEIVLAIGPEGGWTPDELKISEDANLTVVSLGSRILRLETAAMALASVVGCATGVASKEIP